MIFQFKEFRRKFDLELVSIQNHIIDVRPETILYEYVMISKLLVFALQLIFSGEYTKAMNKDWHSGHFCCWQCDESLTGQRYVLRDEHPYCIKCYESVFANGCEECSKIIGIDSKVSSYYSEKKVYNLFRYDSPLIKRKIRAFINC